MRKTYNFKPLLIVQVIWFKRRLGHKWYIQYQSQYLLAGFNLKPPMRSQETSHYWASWYTKKLFSQEHIYTKLWKKCDDKHTTFMLQPPKSKHTSVILIPTKPRHTHAHRCQFVVFRSEVRDTKLRRDQKEWYKVTYQCPI